ncbi:MAG: type I glyceraldehyde-3-phosphate dehydrogenase [Proteobacteria bacterium]|nr:type I glyceraldehyde-3-phosphate dehydrogenase [Pseudomonadota bacterium]
MKPINVAINGFGRIGRCVARAFAVAPPEGMRLVGINSRSDAQTAAHLLKYDSTHGVLAADVAAEEKAIILNGTAVPYSRVGQLLQLPWQPLGVDVVLECSGIFNDAVHAASHIQAGASKVLFSAPAKNADLTVVYGINHQQLTASMQAVSNASCTTNCLAPVVSVLHRAAGITSGMMNTVHSYTNDQQLLDASHKDIRRARAGAVSMIPTKTGAAAAIGLVLPELAGKISGTAVRVPTLNVSLVDFACTLAKPLSVEEINSALRTAAAGELAGVLAVSDEKLVSCDYNGRAESSIVDASLTQSDNQGLVKVFSWYDNEWGFSQRMLDTARAMMQAR